MGALIRKFIEMAVVMAVAAVSLIGCSSENVTENVTVSDTVKNEVEGTYTNESSSQQMSTYDAYSDTDYNVPDGYTDAIDGRQYGESEIIEYYSTYAHKYKKAEVILPYGYDTSKAYPVLYLLHGMGGDYGVWGGMGAKYIVQNAHYDYDAPDMIIVSPTVFTSATYDSEEGLSFKVLTSQYDNFFYELEDNLMPLIESRYSVKTGRDNTAIAGYSLGGRESSYIGFRDPARFGYIGAFSATNGIFKDEVWADAALKGYDCTTLKDNYKLLLYQVGTEDPYIQGVREFKQLFDEYGVQCLYYEMPGSHEGAVWQHGLYNFARRIFR